MAISAPILLELTASDSHLAMLTPVVHELKRRELPVVVYSDCEILRKPSNLPALEALGVPFVRLAQAPLPGADLDWELRAAPLRREIERHVARLRPSAVVVLNDRNFPSNTFVRAARRVGSPSILLQESMRKDLFQRPTWRKLAFRWRRRLMFGIEGGLRKYGQGGCDWYAAWGEMSREYFERVGVPAARIRITGNPRFDQLATGDWTFAAREARRKMGVGEDEFPLTFLSSPIEKMLIISAEEKDAALRRLLEWVADLRAVERWKNVRLRFKLHRGESAERFSVKLHEWGTDSFASVVEMGLYPLVAASRCVLMFSTTAGLEAALLRRPVGILTLSHALDDWDFVGRGLASAVASREDLERFLIAAAEGEAQGEAARRAATSYLAHVGTATPRTCDLIEAVARGEQPA
jgi:hypothetical protein